MKARLLLVIASFFMTSSAFALVEARLTYGLLSSKPDLAKLAPTSTADMPSIVPNYGIGFDGLFFPPLLDWGFGIRQENLGLKASGNGIEAESKATRTAVLVTYRLIDTILHVGPIFSYGISHSNSFDVYDGATTTKFSWEGGSASSYQVGLDVGMGLGFFVLGGEAGYQSMKVTGMKSSASAETPDADMSGTYMKLYFGFGI